MKKALIIFCSLFFSTHCTIPTIIPCQTEQEKKDVANMVANNDDENTFIAIKEDPEEKKQLMLRLLKRPDGRHFMIKKKEHIIAFLSLTKIKTPSKELAQEYKEKGADYEFCRLMIEARKNLPEKSTGYVARFGVIVASNHRRKGYGKKLVLFAEQKASEDSQIEAIEIDVEINNKPAVSLYTSLGYQEVARNEEIGLLSLKKEIKH